MPPLPDVDELAAAVATRLRAQGLGAARPITVDVDGLRTLLGVDRSAATLRRWAAKGIIPRPRIQVAGARLWRVEDLEEWAKNGGRQ